jgi:hypothetical protein
MIIQNISTRQLIFIIVLRQTKLKAAATIAKAKSVTIVGCGTKSAEQSLRGEEIERGSVISPLYI